MKAKAQPLSGGIVAALNRLEQLLLSPQSVRDRPAMI